MDKLVCLLLFLMITVSVIAQDLPIKELEQMRNSDKWLVGKGEHASEQRADKLALEDLISQISVQVSNKFFEISIESESELNSYTESVKRTYSSTNLNNVSKSIFKNRKDWVVYRYVRRNEMNTLFNQRKALALDYFNRGVEAEQKLKIGDALNNYYWSYVIVRTVPNWDEIYTDSGLLMTILPDNIRRIYRNLTIEFNYNPDKISDYSVKVDVEFLFKGIPANSMFFRYFHNNFWSDPTYFAQDNGQIELKLTDGKVPNSLEIDVLHDDEFQAYHNKELANILNEVEQPHFPESSFTVKINSRKVKEKAEDNQYQAIKQLFILDELSSSQSLFQPEAYQKFQTLLSLYNPKVISTKPDRAYSEATKSYKLKGVNVELQTSQRKITEELVFHYTEDGVISDVNFVISEQAVQDLIGNVRITDYEKEIIINFIEQYKTAYTLKNFEFINQVFAKNALIIVGQKLKVCDYDPREELTIPIKKTWDSIQLTKDEYISRLRNCFNNNNFVYLKFEDNNLMRSNHHSQAIFGLQIHQYYYSETYSDEGYLFLLFDLTDITQPIIYVRTWQPDKHLDGSIYGLQDFYLPEQ